MRFWFLLGALSLTPVARATVHVKDVRLVKDGDGWRVTVHASGKTAYAVHSLPDPNRLIIDVPNAVLDLDTRSRDDGSSAPTVRYSQFSRDPNSVRVVVSLPEGAAYRQKSRAPSDSIVVCSDGIAQAASAKTSRKRFDVPLAPAPAERVATSRSRPEPKAPRSRRASLKGFSALPDPRQMEKRSALASRGGIVDRSDILEGMQIDGEAPTPVTPAWTPEEAVGYIRDGDAPNLVRKRLMAVVSDPAIQSSRYVWGAETPGQFDCSGLALYVYDALDVKLPRCSWQQCEVGDLVEKDDLRGGDLVFFDIHGKGVSHVGIYLGDGHFLHAANKRSNLQITSLDNPYYAKRFVCARRVFPTDRADSESIGG
ncbi:MAG TPA: NlpC/P60 family protein [Armatimonadota bacterium]|jgi:cell wall-associated NlpC family hydrolase